jgi:uncharacterized MAPEG superfamily protein
MKPELFYLTLAAAFTGLLWVPYVLERMVSWGLMPTVGYPDNPPAQAPWAQRMIKAHRNAVENLVVFGALVLAAQDLNISNAATAMAAMLYFWARVVHVIAYTLALPWVRTLAFTVGFLSYMTFAWQILGH